MKRFIKMSSVTVFLLASSAYGFEFNFLKDVKAQYEKTLKEAEEKQKNPEEYEKKLRAEWIQEIKDVCTQSIELMAVKYTDTPEEIKAKYDNADKIIENVYKNFDALYKKQIQNIGYSNGGDTYYRNVRIGSPNTYLSAYLNMNFDTNGNVYYTSIDGKPSGDIEIDNEYYLESTYNLEPILEFYLYRIGGTYREQNRLQDAFNSAVKRLTSIYKNSLDNASNIYQERKEKMTLNEIKSENASNTNGTEIDIKNMKFNSLAEKKAYIAQKEKEAEEKAKAKEENEKDMKTKWLQEVTKAYTKAFKLMAIKNTDSLEIIEQKYKERDSIVQEAIKIFDELYAEHIQFISHNDEGLAFHNTTIVAMHNIVYVERDYFSSIVTDSFGNLYSHHYGDNKYRDENGKIIDVDSGIQKNDNYYVFEPQLISTLWNRYARDLDDEPNSQNHPSLEKIDEYTQQYSEELNNAYNTYGERQEKLKQKAKIDIICNAWLKKAQKNNHSLKKGSVIRTSTGKRLVIDGVHKDYFEILTPFKYYDGSLMHHRQMIEKKYAIPESEFKTRPIPECGYGN